MSGPAIARLWIAAAEHALDAELAHMPLARTAAIRSQLRVAAITAEDLVKLAAGPRGAARSASVAGLVEHFGDRALDIDFVGAVFIEEAVATALEEIGFDRAEADRVADSCCAAVLEAAAAIDTLRRLVVD